MTESTNEIARRGAPPTHGLAVLDVPLYPRSAQVLLDILEEAPYSRMGLPRYVLTDLDNLRNYLRSHLQRVALGL